MAFYVLRQLRGWAIWDSKLTNVVSETPVVPFEDYVCLPLCAHVGCVRLDSPHFIFHFVRYGDVVGK
jgi:hypothetical protein